jgi:transcriptional regulator with XRE-family HTH domain
VKQLVRQRHRLGITQDDLNHTLGVADRLVSHWECGVRSPTAFHLYCWADALKGQFVFVPNGIDANKLIIQLQSQLANDNSVEYERSANDNKCLIPEKKVNQASN